MEKTMENFKIGYDDLEDGADFKSYCIDVLQKNNKSYHYGQIVIYGNEELRDKILNFLKTEEKHEL